MIISPLQTVKFPNQKFQLTLATQITTFTSYITLLEMLNNFGLLETFPTDPIWVLNWVLNWVLKNEAKT